MSAGILLVDNSGSEPTFLLVHPGGPLWAKKDEGAWSIPKGEYQPDEDPAAAARREFEEELGVPCPSSQLTPLGSVRQASGKIVTVWCALGTIDTSDVNSNTFEMIWPPRSGRLQHFPEVDRAAFFTLADAERKILAGQRELLARAVSSVLEVG